MSGFKNQPKEKNWWQKKESARTSFPILLMIFLVKILPFPLLAFFAFPISFCYFLFARSARAAVREFQKNAFSFYADPSQRATRRVHPYRTFLSFAICLLEKVAGWAGKASLKNVIFCNDDVGALKEQLSCGHGAVLITSHLGNSELLRSLAGYNQTGVHKEVGVTAIMDTEVTPHFTNAVARLNPHFSLDVMSSRTIGVDSIGVLQERIKEGGLVVIAGDRVSATAPGRTFTKSFLGKEAVFPFGSFFLASLLQAPVYFVFALRKRGTLFLPRYNMFVSKANIDFAGSRRERTVKTEALCTSFVKMLEQYAVQFPYQWYNFYSFWEQKDE